MTVQALYTAATGMNALETKLDSIANNMANMETVAFKKDRANFEDLFYRQERMPGAEDQSGNMTGVGIAIGLGTQVSSVQSDFNQGAFKHSSGDLDVAIEGKGFFKVQDVSGDTLYTRAGNFSRDAQGRLVMGSASSGRQLIPAITIPEDAIKVQIDPDGTVKVQVPGSSELTNQGQLELATFINPQGLLKKGENLYAATEASGAAQDGIAGQEGFGMIRQHMLESSNVEPVSELIDLITTQRAFELNSQVVQAGDQVMQLVANLRRG